MYKKLPIHVGIVLVNSLSIPLLPSPSIVQKKDPRYAEHIIAKRNVLTTHRCYKSDNELDNKLFKACTEGTREEIEAVLDEGADPFSCTSVTKFGFRSERTAVDFAAQFGNVDFFKACLARGTKFNKEDIEKIIQYSLEGLYHTVLDYFLETGMLARVSRKFLYLQGALVSKAVNEYHSLMYNKYKIKHEIDSCLLIEDLRKCIKILKQATFNLNARDWNGKSALFHAVDNELPEVAHLLINEGACSISVFINLGTSLELRKEKQRTEYIKMLLDAHGIIMTEVPFELALGNLFHHLPQAPLVTENLDTNDIVSGWRKNYLLSFARISYALNTPLDGPLKESYARIAEILLGLRRYFKRSLPYVEGWILTADASQHPHGKESRHRADLIAIFLDQLRWGNPQQNHVLMQAKELVIEFLTQKLIDAYRIESVKNHRWLGSYEGLEEELKINVAQGINDRLTTLSHFGSTLTASNVIEVKALIKKVYPHSSEKWRDYILKAHNAPMLLPIMN